MPHGGWMKIEVFILRVTTDVGQNEKFSVLLIAIEHKNHDECDSEHDRIDCTFTRTLICYSA